MDLETLTGRTPDVRSQTGEHSLRSDTVGRGVEWIAPLQLQKHKAQALSGAAEGIPMRSDRSRRLASREKKAAGRFDNNKAKDCSVVFLDQELRKRRERRGEG